MTTMGRWLTALIVAAPAALAGCGVGTWHIPNVPPVVKPEPEKDMFEGLDLEEVTGGSSDSGSGSSSQDEALPEKGGDSGEAAPKKK